MCDFLLFETGLTVVITMDKIEVAAGAPRGLLGVTAIKVLTVSAIVVVSVARHAVFTRQ